jgi:hypothetical protein
VGENLATNLDADGVAISPPALPLSAPAREWIYKLYQSADRRYLGDAAFGIYALVPALRVFAALLYQRRNP